MSKSTSTARVTSAGRRRLRPALAGVSRRSPRLRGRPAAVFYAPSLDYYVVTRYEDVEAIFLDHETFSAARHSAVVPLVPEAQRILFEGGHRPQPSMVLDSLENTRLRAPTGRVHAAARGRVRAAGPRDGRGAARRDRRWRLFDVVGATQRLPETMIFCFMGVARGLAAAAWWGGTGRARVGTADAEEQVEHATSMAASGLPARPGLIEGRAPRRRLCERAARDRRRRS